MKKEIAILLILSLSSLISAQALKGNESKEDFTSHYFVTDNNINIRAEPNLHSSKVGKITTQREILVNPFLSQTKEKIENYEGYWLRCYVPNLDIYGYVFSQYFEFNFGERRTSKVPEMINLKIIQFSLLKQIKSKLIFLMLILNLKIILLRIQVTRKSKLLILIKKIIFMH